MRRLAPVLLLIVALLALPSPTAMGNRVAALDPCARARALLDAGRPNDAQTILAVANDRLRRDVRCTRIVVQSAREARQIAAGLAARASTTNSERRKVRLATLALRWNADNSVAYTLVGPMPPTDTPGCSAARAALDSEDFRRTQALLDALKEVEDAEVCRADLLVELVAIRPDPDLAPCVEAQRAIDEGYYAEARAILGVLADDETASRCRTDALADLEAEERGEWPARLRDAVASDWLTLIVVVLVAMLLGLILGSNLLGLILVSRWSAARILRRFRPREWTVWVFAALTVLGVILYQVGWSWFAGSLLTFLLLMVVACLTGAVKAIAATRDVSVVVEVVGDQKAFAAQVVAEIAALGTTPPSGVRFASGTDMVESPVTAALGKVNNPVVGALVAVLNAVKLTSQVKTQVALGGTAEEGHVATVTMYERGRFGEAVSIPGSIFWRHGRGPSEAEKRSSLDDLATGVAAAVLLWRLGVRPGKSVVDGPNARPIARLYGATDPLSVALCAVASRRPDSGGAYELFGRAQSRDGANRAAQVGRVTAGLREHPRRALRDSLVVGLESLRAVGEEEHLPMCFRVLYNLWAAQANRAVDTGRPELWRKAESALVQLVRGLDAAGADPCPGASDGSATPGRCPSCGASAATTRGRSRSDRSSLDNPDAAFLRTMRVLACSAAAVGEARDGNPGAIAAIPYTGPPATQLNAACAWGLVFKQAVADTERDRASEQAAVRLRLAGPPTSLEAIELLFRDPFLAPMSETAAFIRLSETWASSL